MVLFFGMWSRMFYICGEIMYMGLLDILGLIKEWKLLYCGMCVFIKSYIKESEIELIIVNNNNNEF